MIKGGDEGLDERCDKTRAKEKEGADTRKREGGGDGERGRSKLPLLTSNTNQG